MIVLDASVLAKLFLAEPLSDRAESVVARHSPLFAPDIARVEVASAIILNVPANHVVGRTGA